jgi:PIN domain nuclease of toxin-antitoxin system
MPIVKQLKQHKLLLDTHVWIWLAMGDERLSETFKKAVNQQDKIQTLFISAISIWELGMLVAHNRIELELDCLDWVNTSLDSGLQVLPLSPSVAVESSRLPENPHGDPADRILIATAREHHTILVTHDKKLLNYGKSDFINVFDPCK